MKTAIITLSVLFAVATPSLASESLRLLATISHAQAKSTASDLEGLKDKQGSSTPAPKPPKPNK